jgi:hypothetical protein
MPGVNLKQLGVEPGVYVSFSPTTSLPTGLVLNVLALIGRGADTKIEKESIVKSAGPIDNLSYTTTNSDFITTINDQYSIIYKKGVDFLVKDNNKIDWSLNGSPIKATLITNVKSDFDWSSLSNKSLTFSINGASPTTVVFGTISNIDDVINSLNSSLGDYIIASSVTIDGVNQIKIIVKNLQTFNYFVSSSIEVLSTNINDGLTLLGWYDKQTEWGSKSPKEGNIFYVSYPRQKIYPDDYQPKYFFSYSQIVDEYGEINVNDPMSTSLSLGAKIAFENNVSALLCVPLNPNLNDYVGVKEALEKLKNYDCSYIVPLTNNTNILTDLKNHVDFMSSLTERKPRKAMFGLPEMSRESIISLAKSLNDMRITLVYPFIGKRTEKNVTLILPSSFIACELAAKRCAALLPSQPLLRNELVSFEDINDTWTRTEKNLVAGAGVTIVEKVPNINVMRVRDWLTTSQDSLYANGEVVDVIDYVMTRVMNITEGAFIGKPLTDEIILLIYAFITNFLESLVFGGIISSYENLVVNRNTTEPTQVDVSFAIKPIFTLKYIYINFTI